MVQYGLKLGSSASLTGLAYAYTSSANKLARVTDAVNDPNTRLGDFKDGANTGADDYLYDVNGNLTQDLNKGIANIVYNQLNLPEFIDLVEKERCAILIPPQVQGSKNRFLTGKLKLLLLRSIFLALFMKLSKIRQIMFYTITNCFLRPGRRPHKSFVRQP
ncbi:MAG: hypothetical protein IPI36_08030 [Chitinophagaceae bacterium]|nr:hypothetical protein [Chitinophagaceae bacterium]